MISHQGAVNTILDINQRFGITEQDSVLGLSSLSFDLSVYDIFGTLAAGATLVIPDAELTKDPAHWANLIHQHKVTIWNSVPALMQLLVEHLEATEQKTDSLRLVLMSGDWIPLNLPERIWNRFNNTQTNTEIISLGGATEASIWSIAYPIKEINPDWKSIPYGYPLKNQQFYVLNEAMEPCPIWVTGQLYIGGIGLAQGYLNQPQLTAEKFINYTFVEETSPRPYGHPSPYQGEGKVKRLYKTGDLGRYLPDGTIEFLGREDFQVKVNGYRIELGEIETVLLKNPLIQEAVVTAIGDFENKQLVAYIVPNPVEKIDFKLQQLGIRRDEGRKQIQLPHFDRDDNTNQAYLRRQSYRKFLQQPINLNQFSQWIGSLAQMQLKDSPLPKYRYGSAGSLYPVQAYLHVKDNRIEGLEPGVYYYHPANHNLILLNQESAIENQVYSSNQEIFAESGFSLFLIAELAAITPVYGDKARDFCMLEAGYISQLLMETAPDFDIGLCPIGVLEFETIRESFNLASSQILLHSFVGGKIDPTWTQKWMSSEPQQSISISERLRQYLQQKLPDYMVPSHYMLLDNLPLTNNGKIDRKALPKPQLHGQNNVEFVAPKTELEKKIAQIWQNALKLEQIGIHDNFFEVGGNSLSATQVITQMRQTLQVEITIRHFFEAPTIAEQAQVIQQQPKQTLAEVETIKKVERNSNEEILENLQEMSEEDVDALLKKMMEE